ncbi:MAG: hypothetical protein AAB758_02890 [Patescibacteria group bacterium]
MKKLLIISGSLVVIIALAAWFFLSDSSITPSQIFSPGSPFGSGEDINISTNNGLDTVGTTTPFDQNVSASKLFRISNTPVAGFVILARGSDTAIRYVDRATGHISETIVYASSTTNMVEKVRITNKTLPKIYEAYFRPDSTEVLLRSLLKDSDSVENLTLTLTPPKASSTNELYAVSATSLRGDVDSIVSGAGNALFYVLRDTGAVVSSTFTGSNTKTLFTSPFKNWRLATLGGGVMVYPKASANTPGAVYSLSNGTLTKLAGPLNGITAVGNSDGKKIAYSYTEGRETRLFIKDVAKNTSFEILPTTLAEKCVWSTKDTASVFCAVPVNGVGSGEPDGWYQGKTHFSDYIWQFNANSEISQLIAEPKVEFGIDLDIYKPKVSPNENLLVFINKRDMTLWAVRLK